jgi:hypothetical protein
MRHRKYLFIAAALIFGILTASIGYGDTPPMAHNQHTNQIRHGDDQQHMADHVRAVASLEPIGAVEGWGRAMVTDQLSTDGAVRRFVLIRVVGLEVSSQYAAAVTSNAQLGEAEILIGEFQTDEFGDGYLRLGWPDGQHPPVPEEMPPASNLALALVYDQARALALEGEFTIDWFGGTGPSEITHLERIVLESTDDPRLRGVAKVVRTVEDDQVFETRACRLDADANYQVTVDGILAAIVTTDGVGHGELVLSTADGSLPADLQPIEGLRVVEWVNGNDDVVLTGSFTGENMAGGHGGGVPGGPGNGDPGGHGGGGSGGGNGGGSGGGNGGGNGGGSGGGNGGGNGDGGNSP